MEPSVLAVVMAGALAGGFVNGLTGFGTGLTAMGLWLLVLPPQVAATLVVVTSLASQMQNLPLIWGRVEWPRVLPFVLPGLLAAPLGTLALAHADRSTFRLGIGLFLVAYAAQALLLRRPVGSAWGGRPADVGVGVAGGILGGLAGFSGALLVVWTDFRGEPKERRRMILQAFNLTIIGAALGLHAWAGFLTRDLGIATLAALPGTIAGAAAGARLYRRMGDASFREVILGLLLLSGLTLVLLR